MRKVFLDGLPREKGTINWKETVGYKLPFIYDGIEGEIDVVKYNEENNRLCIRYKNKIFEVNICSIVRCRMGRIFKDINNEFRYDIGTPFKDDKRDLVIIGRAYREDKNKRKRKYYKFICNVCKWTEGEVEESQLRGGGGCACCHGKPVLGINTIWDTDKWMVDLGVSEEDAKSYTSRSGEKIIVKCPECGKEKNKQISDIYNNKSIGCACGDGFSYPEKFMASIFNQLKLDIVTQSSKNMFNWCNNYKYDFYIPEYNCIVETHGNQHYEEIPRGRTLEEEQENDRIKKELALANGIKHYIELDCRRSNLEWIRESILNSLLSEMFNLSKVDWSEADLYAIRNNKGKDICNYWNEHPEATTADLAIVFDLDKTSIINYLKKGCKLNWCNYDPKEEMRKSAKRCNSLKAKEVEIFKDGKSLGVFESCNELGRRSEEFFGVKLDFRNISAICNGKGKTYKGFTFKYTNNNKNDEEVA